VSAAPFVARNSRWRIIGLIAIGLVFVAIGLAMTGMIGSGPHEDDHVPGLVVLLADLLGTTRVTALHILGWLCVGLFGLIVPVGIARLRDTGPVMRIDAQGVWWKSWSDRVIPWSQIREPRMRAMGRQRFLTFDLADPQAHASDSRLQRRLSGANRALGFGHVSLIMSGLDRSFDELVEAFERFRPA